MNHTLPHPGTLEWIGLRPVKIVAPSSVTEAVVENSFGLVGDHYTSSRGNRMVTLIQAEHIEAVGRMRKKTEAIDPRLIRRNLVVSGINLLAFEDNFLRIGEEVILAMTGICEPCNRMEENLGPGGYNAMRGHGGITTKVVQGGTIKVGDKIWSGGPLTV